MEWRDFAYLFAELLVNGIADVFDRDAVAVASRHFQTQWPLEVDPADWWVTHELLEIFFVFDGVG